MISQRYS